ncbi:MAG: iron-sulfur cluster repair di-iron protein [Fibrobacteria bacterium]|jgi:regulator of cell morphogenesis and NO signaling|nr:iron-sulfur cluster repair di-iron protein [Fibrobacteria bacterium]
MSTFQVTDTIARILKVCPETSRVFEKAGMDYCCGGGVSLEAACKERRLDTAALLTELEACAGIEHASEDVSTLSLAGLADHIESTHHAYLRAELPRLLAMTEKVAMVHGGKESRLLRVHDTFTLLARELSEHLDKEEQILFPMVRQLDGGAEASAFHCGSVANPVAQMEREHDEAESSISELRALTDGYVPPKWACGTYRAMLSGLARFEGDLLIHIYKESTLLFPRAVFREQALSAR